MAREAKESDSSNGKSASRRLNWRKWLAIVIAVLVALAVLGALVYSGPEYDKLEAYNLNYQGHDLNFSKPPAVKERSKKANYAFLADTKQQNGKEGFYSGIFALVSPLSSGNNNSDALYQNIKLALDQKSGKDYESVIGQVHNYVDALVSGNKNFKVNGVDKFTNPDIKGDAWVVNLSFTTSNDIDCTGKYVVALSPSTKTEYDFSFFALRKVWDKNQDPIQNMLNSVNID